MIWLPFTASVNASSNWFAICHKNITFRTLFSHWLVQGSKWDKVETFQKSLYLTSKGFPFPNDRKTIYQSDNQQTCNENIPIKSSRYLTIEGELKWIWIPKRRWDPIFVRWRSDIGTCTTQPKVHRWKLLGCWPSTSCDGEHWW